MKSFEDFTSGAPMELRMPEKVREPLVNKKGCDTFVSCDCA